MKGLRVWTACLLAATMVMAFAIATAPRVRANTTGVWQQAFSDKCSSTSPCAGWTSGQGWCNFSGTPTGGTVAVCKTLFTGSIGVLAELIQGTAWDVELSPQPPKGTGMNDFFITDGTVTFTGLTPALIVLGGGVPDGCTTNGVTITCPIPVVENLGLYSPDTLSPVIPGHLATDTCFATGVPDSGCSSIQQLTWVS